MTDTTPPYERPLSRRSLLKTGIGLGGALAAGPFLAACGGSSSSSSSSAASSAAATTSGSLKGSGKLIVGAFDDPALVPFRNKMIGLFKQETGITIEFLTEPYDSFKAKAFSDGQAKAGQFDIYILDDPWIPQFGAANTLVDLGAAGITADPDYEMPFLDLGYWPPKSGPRVKGFESAQPKLVALPTIGDLQTLTYRNDVFSAAPATWDDLVAGAKAGVAANKVKSGFVFRGVKGNPIVTSWYPVFLSFGGRFFDDKWNVTFNSPEGKASADFFVTTLKSLAPPGVAEYDSTQEGAAILGGDVAAVVQYSGNAIASNDPTKSKEVGKLAFAVVPKKVRSVAQIGIFIHGVAVSAPNMKNALIFMNWWGKKSTQTALAESNDLPVLTSVYDDTSLQKAHPLLPAAAQQLQVGAEPRPRTPDWGQVELIIGTELNKALVAGSGGGAALDRAAQQATAALKQLGYYG